MEYLLGFALLLGVLIFIHEFGHFIVAKACGVRVETFSIGMGKKFIHFHKGETEYALSILPLGGYVKLTGQDPREEVAPEHQSRSFRNKSLLQRAAIVLAGPFFNAALAVTVFIGLYHVGVPSQAPVLVRILPESLAAKAGFQSGDQVTAIERSNGESERIREAGDIESIVGAATDQPLNFRIERTGPNGAQKLEIAFTPVLRSERDSSVGVIKERGTLPGVEFHEAGPVVKVEAGSWAAKRQLLSSVWIDELAFSVAGVEQIQKIESYHDFEKAWKKAATAQTGAERGRITIKGHKISTNPDAKPSDAIESFQLAWVDAKEAMPADPAQAGVFSHELVLTEIKAGSPAEKLGLKAGDRIVSLNGMSVYSFQSFRNLLQKEATSGQELKLGWYREAQKMEAAIRPELVNMRDPMTEAKKSQFQIGAMFLPTQAAPPETILKGDNLIDTVRLGFNRTVKLTASMLDSFYLLATGEISPKTLGGPILIGKIAGESFKAGPIQFFRMMAFISMNLCILNLIPIPVLDGGHLLLYCIEAIRRKPLSIKIVEAWTTAGFFLLMGLIAVVFFNDLTRLGLFKFLKLS